MRVLIIGCGYVGLPLAAELTQRGHTVSGLRRSTIGSAELHAAGITPLIGDITQPATLAKIPPRFDWVVNCVSSTHGGAEDYQRVYLEGSRNLLAWLAAAPPQKFIYTSSTGVYGQDDGSLVTETAPIAPPTETGQILRQTEELLLAAAAEQHFPAAILRVAGIYGPERGYWLKQFLAGEARLDGDGSRHLNMIHRNDVIGCVIAALENGQAGEVYNACDDEPVTQRDFFNWLAKALSLPVPPSAPANYTTSRKRGVTDKRISNRKLKTELGYRFQFPTFREGYAAEIQRRRSQMGLPPAGFRA